MKKVETGFYVLIMLFCAGYTFSAQSLKIGSFSEPGPGLIPSLLGITGFLLAGVLLFKSVYPTLKEETDGEKHPIFSQKKFFTFLGILIAYIILFQVVEFLLLTLLFIISLAKVFDLEGWVKPIIMGLSFTAAVYVIFIWGFEIPF